MPQAGKMISNEQNDSVESRICAEYDNAPDALIEILHEIQNSLGFVCNSSLQNIAHSLNLSRAEVYGVVSFYEDFKTNEPQGKSLKICRGEACQSMGANSLMEQSKAAAALTPLSVEAVYCLGNCALAPAAMLGNILHGRLTGKKLAQLIEQTAPDGPTTLGHKK